MIVDSPPWPGSVAGSCYHVEMNHHEEFPSRYVSTIRTLVRFAVAMAFVGLLSGLLFQESSKKLAYASAPPGLHIEATIRLALLHGHVFLIGMIIPLCLAFAMVLARRIGGASISPRSQAFLTRGYLPLAGMALGLMLYKAYHVLLAVRGGSSDLDAVYGSLFAGITGLRHAAYGISHTGMAVCLGVFLVALWRSLSVKNMSER